MMRTAGFHLGASRIEMEVCLDVLNCFVKIGSLMG